MGYRFERPSSRSQTPFGCWSDQDKTIKSTMRNDDREPSQTPFGCWSDQDIVADPDNWVTEYLKSQTPFGCWSDQDEHRTGGNRAPGARHKRLSAVGPIRTCTMEQLCKLLTQLSHKRLSAVGPIRTHAIMIKQDTIAATMSQTPFGCWSDQDEIVARQTAAATKSQTPFGCWSDQDCSTKACRFAKDLS